jgi:hypothetical protein
MPSGFGECRGNGCDVFSIDEGFSACAEQGIGVFPVRFTVQGDEPACLLL